MKFLNYVLCFVALTMLSTTVFAQKYKTPADTVKLNEEYVKVKNQIADLNSQLSIAQNNLPGYQSKATTAGINAQSAATTSSTDASKATNGNEADAKTAKRGASKAYSKAQDAESANNKVGRQDEKIKNLKKSLAKKEQRLAELDVMRSAIYAQLPANLHQ